MPLFTRDNAREMQARARESRRLAELARQQLLASAAIAAAKEPQAPPYIAERLARVRLQLDRIDDMLLSEKDPAKLDRLTAAALRLSEIERKLAGRPDPGHLRPGPTKRSPTVDPCDPLPYTES